MKRDKDKLILAQKYLIDEPTLPTDELSEKDQAAIEALRLCYTYVTEHPLATRKERRDQLMKRQGISDRTAYRYIALTDMLIGDTTLHGKNLAKMKVNALLEEQYTCIKNEDYKGADARDKLIRSYIKAFRLDIDEGETLNAKEALALPHVVFTTDLAAINIHPSERELKEQERLKREAGYEEPEFIELPPDYGTAADTAEEGRLPS